MPHVIIYHVNSDLPNRHASMIGTELLHLLLLLRDDLGQDLLHATLCGFMTSLRGNNAVKISQGSGQSQLASMGAHAEICQRSKVKLRLQ